jgi:hypothetical protein
MNRDGRHTHLEIDVDGRAVAAADVEQQDQPGVVQADPHVEPGHQPTGSRARLVDAVLAQTYDKQRLEAALPIGDTEFLDPLRERRNNVRTRSVVRRAWSKPSRPTGVPVTRSHANTTLSMAAA